LRVGHGQGIEGVWQGEYEMPVVDIEEVGALALGPARLGEGLAFWAMAMGADLWERRFRACNSVS